MRERQLVVLALKGNRVLAVEDLTHDVHELAGPLKRPGV